MLKFENNLFKNGIKHIAGIDEAGRGPLAGPIVVAAVILDFKKIAGNNDVWSQINDSKKLSLKKRNFLYEIILGESLSYSIIEIDDKIIDQNGIGEANQIGFQNAIKELKIEPEHTLTDHYKIKTLHEAKQTNITKGDTKSISIAAASILAKVHRDNIMHKMDLIYPEYGFAKHKGYGTKQHLEALTEYGPCDIHRKSFAPIKNMQFLVS